MYRRKDKYYEIIAGERRWRACKESWIKRGSCNHKNYDEKETLKISLIENLQREDLNPIEEAKAYEQLSVQTSAGEKKIGITRIHIEEDVGKLLHDEESGTMLDMNRCGVPLIEIVSEPDIRSAEEAVGYLRKLRAILTYIDVSDCRMNEAACAADVNRCRR